jgi:hypothetical protein
MKACIKSFYLLVNTLRSIVCPQEVVEVSKFLQEKESASGICNAKLIFIHEKKRQRSKKTTKTFEIKNGQKSKNVALEILK